MLFVISHRGACSYSARPNEFESQVVGIGRVGLREREAAYRHHFGERN